MENLLTDTEPNYIIASKGLRVIAALVDFVILMIAGYFISVASGQQDSFNNNSGDGFKVGFSLTGIPALLLMIVWFLLFPLMEGLTGQTIGKKIFKLKVVQQDFSPVTIKNTLVRHLFDIIDVVFLIGLIVAASNNKSQRIGDLVAKSLVVMKE